MSLVAIARNLRREVAALRFGPPLTHVYHPLDYAWEPHRIYLKRYGGGRPEVVLVGMNPGPWGMAQTGVPFGDVTMVRDWLGIEAPVGRPPQEHPKRPVLGFACPRQEVSGRRVWGWARARYGTPERFFSQFFVLNYCPLCFFEASGRNRTPDSLPLAERRPLEAACDYALAQAIAQLQPRFVLGVGEYAAGRAAAALAGQPVIVDKVLHPSPINPASRDWAARMDAELVRLGLAPA